MVLDDRNRLVILNGTALVAGRCCYLGTAANKAYRFSQRSMEPKTQLRENVLEALVEAALQGHALGPFEPVEDDVGFQAICGQCGQSVYVSNRTLYSLLADRCPGS